MKKFSLKYLILISVVSTSVQAFANDAEWRFDAGYYEAKSFWAGNKNSAFANNGKTKKEYFRISYNKNLSEALSMRLAAELSSFKLDGFSMGNAKSGKGQSGISEVEMMLNRSLLKIGSHSFSVDYGVSAPGSEYENMAFDALGTGVTTYKFALVWDWRLDIPIGINSSIGYWWRPGSLRAGAANSGGDGSMELDIPDFFVFNFALPVYLGPNVISLDFAQRSALSGIDIFDSKFMAFAMASNGKLPFPATREMVSIVQLSYERNFDSFSADITVSEQVAGRNTDKGMGINLGFQMDY